MHQGARLHKGAQTNKKRKIETGHQQKKLATTSTSKPPETTHQRKLKKHI